ncbi:hypothetical protein [Actinokineospora sp. NPDC004072]
MTVLPFVGVRRVLPGSGGRRRPDLAGGAVTVVPSLLAASCLVSVAAPGRIVPEVLA